MIPEKVFHQILALGDAWRVTAVDYEDTERKVSIRIEETPQLWGERGMSPLSQSPDWWLRSRARTALAASECVPIGIGDSLRVAARSMQRAAGKSSRSVRRGKGAARTAHRNLRPLP